ncbi:hypothetical protein PILCRDRAFT_757859 [Piloderma croceum F 1598]|uniref:Uncharacterized protein n=1 Tax=Piloderma croceum (strain F 1598) TaxID=765440 RepID=A0A0C3EF50_PILCF|nr:hypothetical protein PILCRDRAFT_757859 [Piloderma croceum F 1598]
MLKDCKFNHERASMLSPSSKELSVLAPVLHFISRFAIQSDSARQTALDSGILDMILRIYVILPTLSDSTRQNADRKILRDASRLTLELLGQSQHQEAVLNHPVCTLWKDVHSQPPGYVIDAPADPAQERCAAWRRVEKSCVERRMIVIYRYTLWKPDAGGGVAIEACDDIVEFAKREFYGSTTVEFAYLAILKHLALSGDSAQHLMDALARGSREDTEDIFSAVIRLWLECVSTQIETSEKLRAANQIGFMSIFEGHYSPGMPPPIPSGLSLHDREKQKLLLKMAEVDSVLFNIIKFITKAAMQNSTVRLGMLDAGSLAIVLTAFADPVAFTLSSLTGNLGKEGKGKGGSSTHRKVSDIADAQRLFSAAISAEASTLSVLIRKPQFIKPWRGHRLETRLSLCSSLIDSLLGGQELDDVEYGVTRALFRNIVAADP